MTQQLQESRAWSGFQKWIFRFFFSWFVLMVFPFPADSIPFLSQLMGLNETLGTWYGKITGAYFEFCKWLIPWLASHVYGIKEPITNFTNGSGDTHYDYLLYGTMLLLALVASIIWSVIDRKRASYNQAYYWLRTGGRYFLGGAMLGYGFAKVFHLQMPFPYLSQLVQLFGDKSPMGLTWSYIGYSKTYSAFTGWGEVIGGLLLFFRRTTLVGALIVAVIMLNVFVINMSYDVPVKLFSFFLFFLSLLLLIPDRKRISAVFFRNQSAAAVQYPEPGLSRKWSIGARIYKVLFLLAALFGNIYSSMDAIKEYGDERPRPPLYGIYNIETAVKNNDTLPLLMTDTTLWKQLVVQFKDFAIVKNMRDTTSSINFRVDTAMHQVTLFKNSDTLNKWHWNYAADSTHLRFWGKRNEDSIRLVYRKYDINRFRLVNRGFHWINEFPFNR